MELFTQAVISGISVGAIYALVAVGYNVVFASTRVFNLAQGQVLMLAVLLVWQFRQGWGWPTVPAIAAACAAAALANLLVERIAVAPIAAKRMHGGAMALAAFVSTLGASIVIVNLVVANWGPDTKPFDSYFTLTGIDVLGATITRQQLLMIAVALAIVATYHVFATRSRWGLGLSAMAEDPEAAALRGVPVGRARGLAFLTAGLISGIGGAAIAPVSLADPSLGFEFTLKGFVAMAIGGFGSTAGALAGGVALGLTEALMVTYGDDEYRAFASLLLLLVVLMVRPRGLLGRVAYREV